MKHLIIVFGLFISLWFTGCSPQKDSSSKFWESHTTPKHLSLAVQRNGVQYYLNKQDYQLMKDSLTTGFDILGVVIDASEVNIKFIVALEDEEGGNLIRRQEALDHYKDILPRHNEAQLILDKYEALSNAIVAFGGKPLTKQNGVDVWWDKDGSPFGYIDIPWGNIMSVNKPEDLVKAAKIRRVITMFNPYKD